MRAVLDTNVLMSAVFFGGVPGMVLEAWVSGDFSLVASPKILDEYRRVSAELKAKYPKIDTEPILDLLTVHAEIVEDRALSKPVSRDADDDTFFACAAAAGAVLVSGDKDLLAVDGERGVRVLAPRAFQKMLKNEG